jgi:hypothetical protein
MPTNLDNRQSRQRSVLDQLSNSTDLKLDTILNLVNDELTMPLRLRADSSPSLRLNIGAIQIQTIDGATGTGRKRTIQPINNLLPSFTPGFITFPSTSGGSITASGFSLQSAYTLTVSAGNYIKVLVALNGQGQVVLTFGAQGVSESAATLPPALSGTLALGYVVLNNVAGVIQNVSDSNIYQFMGGGGGGGSGASSKQVTQNSHGFTVGQVVYLNGSTYALARADLASTAEAVGVVSNVITSNIFEVTELGYITGLSGLIPGEVYFLSDSVAGGLTVNEPTIVGSVSKPMLIADSATSGYVLNYRGVVVGGANARTQISLPNNATTNVQLVAPAYDAGELTGWAYIDGTTDTRFYVRILFSKNGAGTDYNVSYQTSGDTPPAGFLVSYAGNYIRMTLPNITGYVSAYFNYALNAPAIGTTFPLSVDGANVTAASAIAQGAVTTGAQTFAGKKTFDGGALIKGDTSGAAIAAGYVGEQLIALGSELTTSTTGGVTLTLATLPITSAGVWKVEFYVWNIEAAGVNAGAIFMANAKYNDNTFTPTIATNGDNSGVVAFVTQGAAIRGGSYSSIPGFVVATDGTKSVFLRQNITLSSGTAAARGKIVATRIV